MLTSPHLDKPPRQKPGSQALTFIQYQKSLKFFSICAFSNYLFVFPPKKSSKSLKAGKKYGALNPMTWAPRK